MPQSFCMWMPACRSNQAYMSILGSKEVSGPDPSGMSSFQSTRKKFIAFIQRIRGFWFIVCTGACGTWVDENLILCATFSILIQDLCTSVSSYLYKLMLCLVCVCADVPVDAEISQKKLFDLSQNRYWAFATTTSWFERIGQPQAHHSVILLCSSLIPPLFTHHNSLCSKLTPFK